MACTIQAGIRNRKRGFGPFMKTALLPRKAFCLIVCILHLSFMTHKLVCAYGIA